MARRKGNVKVGIVAESDVDKGTRDAEKALDRLERHGSKSLGGLKTAAIAGGAALTASLVVGLKSTADAAIEAESAAAKVQKMVENAGYSWEQYGDKIDEAIQKQSELFGLDDEDLAESFANLVRTTKDINKALELNALAADLARTKGVDLANAQSLIARVYNGSYNGVKRLGVAIQPVTAEQDKLRASTDKVTAAQMRAAKEADKQASAQRAIATLQKQFGGQAEAYAETTKGSFDKVDVAIENLQETVGASLAPTLKSGAEALSRFVVGLQSGEGAGGAVAQAFERVKTVVGGTVGTISSVIVAFKQGDVAATGLVTSLAGVAAGFAAFKLAGAAVAGVGALKTAVAGLVTTMKGLKANPIGIVITALGALAGTLGVLIARERAAADTARDHAAALRSVKEAANALKDAEIQVTEARANARSASVAVDEAEKRLRDLRKSGTASALEIRRAEADLRQARALAKRANFELGESEKSAADARRKHTSTMDAAERTQAKAIQGTRQEIAAKQRKIDALKREQREQDANRGALIRAGASTKQLADEERARTRTITKLRGEISQLRNKQVKVDVKLFYDDAERIDKSLGNKEGQGPGRDDVGDGPSIGDMIGDEATKRGRAVGRRRGQSMAAAGALSAVTGGLANVSLRALSIINRLFGGVRMTSGLRSPAENARVGGAKNSDHLTGKAIDLVPAAGWTPQGVGLMDRIANWAGQQPFVRWVGWRGVPNHGPGNHLHLSFLRRGGALEPHKATQPRMIVYGEDAPSSPEYFIPTAPHSRDRAVKLWLAAGQDLGVTGMAEGGVRGQIRNSWLRNGGNPAAADMAVAIAMLESSGQLDARAVTSREDSRGWFQINVLAHPWAAALNLSNGDVNTRAAIKISGNGRNWSPWSTAAAAAAQLRAGAAGKRGARAPAKLSPGQAAVAAAEQTSAAAVAQGITVGKATIGGLKTSVEQAYDLSLATAEDALAMATAEGNLAAQIAAREQKIRAIQERIRKIDKALKKKLKKPTRTRLLNERAGLIGEVTSLSQANTDALAPAGEEAAAATPFDVFMAQLNEVQRQLDAGLLTEAQALDARVHLANHALLGRYGTLSREEFQQAQGVAHQANVAIEQAKPKPIDFANLALAEAALTPDIKDDQIAASDILRLANEALATARQTGDPREVLAAMGVVQQAQADLDRLTPKAIDFAEAALAKAGLTETLDDDLAATKEIERIRAEEFAAALATEDPRDDTAAANALKSAQEAVKQLTGAIDNTNQLLEQSNALAKENGQRLARIEQLNTTQFGEFRRFLADWFSGQIGGLAGMAVQSPSAAGVLSAVGPSR